MKKRYMMALLAAAMMSLTACGSSEEKAAEVPAQESTGAAESTAAEVEYYDSVTLDMLKSKVVNLGQYMGMETEKVVQEITDADVQEEIDSIKRSYATLEDVDRAAKMGDTTVIDFDGTVDGEPRDGMQGTEYQLELGSGAFIPGFEEQLVGASAGDDVTVNVTFPEDYHSTDLAGVDAVFECHVHKVQEYVNADWNDAFIKENLGVESEDALRADIRSEMEALAEEAAEANVEYNLVMELVENSEFEIAEEDIEAYTNEMLNQYISMGAGYGLSLEDIFGYLGTTEEDIRAEYKETAIFTAKMVLALQGVIDAEGLEASDADYEAYVESLAADYGYTANDVKVAYGEKILREQALQEKAVDLMRANAVIK